MAWSIWSAGPPNFDALGPDDYARAASHGVDMGERDGSHHGTLAFYLAAVGRHAEAHSIASDLLQRIDRAAPSAADAHYALGLVHAMLGRPDAAHAAYAYARRLYHAAGNPYLAAVAATEELIWVALPYGSEQIVEREALAASAAAALAEAVGMRAQLSPPLARLPLLILEGHWDEARELGLPVRQTASDAESFVAPGLLGALAYHQGDSALAWSLVREALPDGPSTPPGGAIYTTALAMQRLAAMLACDAGDLTLARAWLAAHDRWLGWGGAVLGQAQAALAWARWCHTVGDLAAARNWAERAVTRAQEPRQALVLLAAQRLLGQIETEDGRLADATRHLSTALQLAESCAARYGRALTLLALATLLQRQGAADDARVALDEAREICSALGATVALAAIDALAAAPPAAPASPTYPAGLTAREVEVLRLVVNGHTNQEIADLLSLSMKTVINHITHILTKTGAENRAAATAFALRQHLA